MHVAATNYRSQSDELGEEALIERAKDRDESAVRMLVQQHNQQLFRVARGIVHDDVEAEDVVQATYVRAFTHLDTFRGDSSFATWLTRIALNEALGRLRRRRPMVELSELDTTMGGDVIMFPTTPQSMNPENETGRTQVRQVLERAVDELPDPFRIVFMLREVQGLSTEETADYLSLKVQTVKTRLHRARHLLRASIERMLSPQFSDLFPFDGARCAHMADRVVAELRKLD